MSMVTALYAGLASITIIVLAARVSRLRRKYRVGTGCGAHADLDLAIRCHANATENIPIGLILLFIAETQDMGVIFLHLFGFLLVISRILHSWGLTVGKGGVAVGRFYGTVCCWLSIIFLSLYNIVKYVLSLV